MQQVTCKPPKSVEQPGGDGCADPLGEKYLDELQSQVQCSLGGRVREFRVELKKGGLVLRGQSSTYHGKQLAQQRVMERSDVPILANEIVVE
jgi:hypothetical protein